MNWKSYWSEYPKQFAADEYERQVKSTVKGLPVPAETIRNAIESITTRLALGPDDSLLDVCCGNGLLTTVLAGRCRSVVGIDFSETLIAIAATAHASNNVVYRQLDALDLSPLAHDPSMRFTKIVMNAGLQYFREAQLAVLLRELGSVLTANGTILLTAVPDHACMGRFYNTSQRRLRHWFDCLTGRDQMGTWWRADLVRRVAEHAGLQCEFYRSNYHVGIDYRFDVRFVRKPDV